MKRQRGRSRRNNNQHNANRSMESNGPDVKVRGTAKQIFDKYEGLARDAASSGNRVKAENFRQHAEHYLRIVNAIEAAKEKAREEAEAAKAEAGGDESGEEKDDNRSRRRYPPQVRKGSEAEGSEEKAKSDKSDETPEVSEETNEPQEAKSTPEPKSTRRRKAPSREPAESEDAPAEAAE